MKKIIKIGVLPILSLVILYFAIFAIQNYTLTNSFSKETNTVFDHDTQFIRCNLNIFEPEFAFVYGHISFEKSKNMFYQTEQEWDINRTGGTTVKNTTFPQLLKMVKEDCYQFQKSNSYKKETDMYWTYGKYTPAKPKTKEEIEQEKQDKIEEEELLRKIESGEIIPKSTYDTLIESGLSEEATMDVIEQMKEARMTIYE